MDIQPVLLQEFSWVAVGLVFLGGLVTSLGPCNLATIPLIVGYVGGASCSRARSLAYATTFAIGLALTFMILGVAAGMIGGIFIAANRIWYYLVAGLCFLFGLHMLGVISISIPMVLGGLRERIGLRGIPGALALGLVSGLVASQCATPVLAAILTYVMAKGAMVYGAGLLFIYALGRGVPIILAGTFTGALKQMQALQRWNSAIEKASGLIMIMVGFYFLWTA